MTTAHLHRPWFPALNLLLAGGAAALAVIAITSDDVGSTTPAPAPGAIAFAVPPLDEPSAPADECRNGPAHGLPFPC